MIFKADENNVRVLGRTEVIDDVRYMNYTCSGIEFEFTGTSANIVLTTDYSNWDEIYKTYVAVFIDDESAPRMRFCLKDGENTYKLYEESVARNVKIKIIKMSEAAYAKTGIKQIIIDGSGIKPTESKEHRIEFIGDSITCGYGNEGVLNKDAFDTAIENGWEAFAAKTARYFDADFNCISWSGIGVISSYSDDDTPKTQWLMPMLYKFTDAALDRDLGRKEYEIWDNSRFVPQLIVVNLGTNDTSYTKEIDERKKKFEDGYYEFIKQIRSSNPDSEILCTLGVMGQVLCPSMERAVNRYKKETDDEKIHTMIFKVQSPSDGIAVDNHPSLKTHDKMSKELIKRIKEIMNW